MAGNASIACTERERLAAEYGRCVDRFRVAVFTLRNLRGSEFDRAYAVSEQDRIAVEQARLALDRHRTEHRC